jgi:hypothetical protein
MTSNIISTNIDTAFPIPGVDNDSQGFRDNFINIKTALTTASIEISELQLTTVKANTSTNLNGNVLENVKFKKSSELALNSAPVTGDVNFNSASFHKLAINTSTTFAVSNWPTSGAYSKVLLQISPTTSTTININFGAGIGTLLKTSDISLPYVSTVTNSTLWELWTSDGGSTVFLEFRGGPFI